jgi:Tol biopolymer transport system component
MTLGGPYASCPVWTDDGALLIGADTGEIRRWELTEEGPRPSPLLTLPTGLSPAYLATLRDGTLFVVWQHASDWNWFGLGAVAPDHAVRTVEERLSPLAPFIARDGAGAGVYYVRPAPTGRELVWRPAAGEARLAANGVLASSGVAVSPDRTRMVYSTCLEYQYLVRLRAGAAPADITSRSEWRDRAPIRADARRFVYTSDRSGHDQLLVYDLGSGASAVLAERSSRRGAVSPDGKLVAFHDDAAGGLFVAPLAGGGATPRRLTTDATDADPQFSHDAAYVFFVRATPGGSRLFAVPAAGGDAVQITTTDATSPAASPVADLVVYISSTPRGETVMATDAAGSFHRPFRADLGPAVYRSPRFSPDGKRLLLSRKHTEVVEVPVSGGKPEVRWRATVEGIDALDYAPDGDGYVASIILWDGDLWLADGVFP